MNLLPCAVPTEPDWCLNWEAIDSQFEWIKAMKNCPQEPVFHGEGDVWTHVQMVCQALIGLLEWQSLPENERELLFAAALLHDVSKPACTRTENGRITSRGHSQRGAIQARRILWEFDDADFARREQVCALIRYHQTPFHLLERQDSHRTAFLMSQTTRCDLLMILAKADALGRECADQEDLLTRIELCREFFSEQECLHTPKQFPSTLSRFEYFRSAGRDCNYKAYDESKCEVILMSGLPGSGKDTWIARHAVELPQISLDAIREEIGAEPTGNQGAVIQAARERARIFLRQGQSFVWNATNLNRDIRSQLIDLFTAYQARVRIVYVEAPQSRLWQQNENRTHVVPRNAMEKMIDHWDLPDPTEAPLVEWWENTGFWTKHELLAELS